LSLVKKPSDVFTDYKKQLMPVGAITIGDGTTISDLLKQSPKPALSMYILPTDETEIDKNKVALTDFSNNSLDVTKTYTNFRNAELATLLKSYFLPASIFNTIYTIDITNIKTEAKKENAINKKINEIVGSYLSLPVIPLTLPIAESDIIKNPKWLIRAESLIDEKILGN
jgi:hypothetical protein